jgi:hypothetical protein
LNLIKEKTRGKLKQQRSFVLDKGGIQKQRKAKSPTAGLMTGNQHHQNDRRSGRDRRKLPRSKSIYVEF